ncbi:hypothetical protein H2201_006223 [Coniosporium apollinis]|uniref:Xylanolytic transcriptional activator regulatory domain-containing protein n=1 Tax=Coniosporium apollinis TaxID=61459 RepID=A0ABQ9NMQ8_9PEZI|nr:hypothetical protein H2201_006223 [Coniosporium apollinis]
MAANNIEPPAGHRDVEANQFHPLPAFRAGCNGDNYLGISSADFGLSPIKATSLTFFGAEIDIKDFIPDDAADEAESPTSYQHFLKYTVGKEQPPYSVPLPSLQECQMYAGHFFSLIHPHGPILCKRKFMELLPRVCGEHGAPVSPAESAMAHMMLAHIMYQTGSRNKNDPTLKHLLPQSHKHYTYCLTIAYQLTSGHSLEDVQALTLISLHLRNFPKPGAAWFMSRLTFTIALELGLHRSVRAWADTAPKMNVEEVETRKRVFWTLHGLLVCLSGKLGRPMPMRIEDMDVEFPEPINDHLPNEESLSDFHKCSFRASIHTAKLLVIMSQMYSTIYAVRQAPQSYESNVEKLEEEIRKWREQVPPEFTDPYCMNREDRITALHLQSLEVEHKLLLHHPTTCHSVSPEFKASNMTACLEAASKMLDTANQLRIYKCLDSTWMTCTVYLAAIFTTLFVHYQRRDDMTSADLAKLRSNMDDWLVIIKDCGVLLGSGDRLQTETRRIIGDGLDMISRHLAKKTASAAAAEVADALASASGHRHQEPPSASDGYQAANAYTQYSTTISGSEHQGTKPTRPTYLPPDDVAQQAHPYPATTPRVQYYTSETPQPPMPAYDSGAPSNEVITAAQQAALATASASAAQYGFTGPYAPPDGTIDMDWRDWMERAVNFGSNVGMSGGQDYLNSASALMALGGAHRQPGQEMGVVGGVAGVPDAAQDGIMHHLPQQGQWPNTVFGMGQGPGT